MEELIDFSIERIDDTDFVSAGAKRFHLGGSK